jgi:hypothetical protein
MISHIHLCKEEWTEWEEEGVDQRIGIGKNDLERGTGWKGGWLPSSAHEPMLQNKMGKKKGKKGVRSPLSTLGPTSGSNSE